MIRSLAAGIVLGGWLGLVAASATAQSDPTTFGAFLRQIDRLDDPAGVAIGADGKIYVSEAAGHRVRILDPDGSELFRFGTLGRERGEFDVPHGIAAGPDGRIYVADSGNHRIQVFATDGKPVDAWGRFGSGSDALNRPLGLTVHAGKVYVADSRNDRIQVFDVEGTLLRSLGRHGTGDGEFRRPVDVAVDADGRLFVTDSGNHRIQELQEDGGFARKWGDFGPFVGLLAEPGGLDVHGGRLFVADTRNHRVQVFDRNGEALHQWGLHVLRPHEGEGKIHYPSDVAVAPMGEFAVVCEAFENRLQIFGPGAEASSIPGALGAEKVTHFGTAAHADAGLLAITEHDSAAILVYDLSRKIPARITDFGGIGPSVAQFAAPVDVRLDSKHRWIVVSDGIRRTLQFYRNLRDPEEETRYDPYMTRFVKSIDFNVVIPGHAEKNESGTPIEPGAFALADDGTIYLADVRGNRILVLNRKLEIVRTFGGHGSRVGEMREPSGIALGRRDKEVFVLDSGNRRVQVFDRKGSSLRAFGGDVLRAPVGITAGKDGFVYVVDRSAHRVLKFDEQGALLHQWGREGLGGGEFYKPAAITQDDTLRLIVIDFGNHRGQIFTPDGEFLEAFGARLYVREAKATTNK